MRHPIISISTSQGNSAIGIIRISFGDILWNYNYFFLKIFKKLIKPRYATNVNFYYKNLILDNGIVIFFLKPYSYTGEDILEFHGHGNYLNLKYILKIFLLIFKKLKIRLANRGEFTKRAFLNKKINLIGVYNILNLINSNNEILLKNIHYNLKFNIYKKLKNIYSVLLNIKNILIYKINYSFKKNNLIKINYKLNYILKKIHIIYKNININNINSNTLILLGSPNVGKSTIINKLTNSNSLIVDSKPGTTRDLVNRNLFINNFKIDIFDTAGLRKTINKVEKIGINFAFKQLKNSKIIFYVYNKKFLKDHFYLKIKKKINKYNIFFLIFNKIDLYDSIVSLEFYLKNNIKNIIIKISAKYNLGINLLFLEINRLLLILSKFDIDNSYILKNIKKIYKYIYISIILKKKNNIKFLYKNINNLIFYFNKIFNFNNKKKINILFNKFCIGK